MKKIDRILNKLSELYEFSRKLKAYKIKEKASKPPIIDRTKKRTIP